MNLGRLLQTRLDSTTKGLPDLGGREVTLADISELRWNLLTGALPTPLATLHDSALRTNSAWMREFTSRNGLKICPHGKTTMAPQLFQRQLADGAWGITVSNVQQVRVCRKFGVRRVLMANQLVDERDIRELLGMLREDPSFDFRCLVDSVDNVRRLHAMARESNIAGPLQLLIEGGPTNGRAGCRSLESAVELARVIYSCAPFLELTGVEGFEGVIDAGGNDGAEVAVARFLDYLGELMTTLVGNGLLRTPRPLLTIGGSIYFDLVASHPVVRSLRDRCDIILRSGCYLTHDSLMLHENLQRIRQRSRDLDIPPAAFRPALTVWGVIQSMPEAGMAILNVGKRDVSHDIDLPVAEKWFRRDLHRLPQSMPVATTTTQINDQHLFLKIPEDAPLRIGDLIGLGVSHPCTTFDKWRLLYIIDDDYGVIEGILTFF